VTRHHPEPPAGGRWSLHRRDQKGVSSVEFALVMVPLFLILYGLITFGMMFALKQSMENAASEAARAAIGASDPEATASATVADRLDWLGSNYNAGDSPLPSEAPCVYDITKQCITVTVTYPYKTKPLLPLAPLMDLFVPSSMTSKATVQLS
jgi:hypothetical protein